MENEGVTNYTQWVNKNFINLEKRKILKSTLKENVLKQPFKVLDKL